MKKETENAKFNESDQLIIKISLSISVNLILAVGVSFLRYEVNFSKGTKLMLLYAAIIFSYIIAFFLHTIIFIKKPIKKYKWIYFLITAIGLIPHTWYFMLFLI